MPDREHAPPLERSLGRVEGKIDSLLEALKEHFEDDRENFSAMEKRIAGIEHKVYWFSGAWATVGAVIVYLFKH